jgi:LAO/AO transport system kinase
MLSFALLLLINQKMHFHPENSPEYIGLKVNEGIEQPQPVSPDSVRNFLSKRRRILPAENYVEGILKGDITLLSKAVTLVESSKHEHQQTAQKIIEMCLPHSGESIRIGITGVPGVGKSTFIEALGKHITNQGHKLAVLAIDPSSERTRGSILGDKTRMEELSADPKAYIRPSPSAGSLGGVARKTRETIVLCEAAGFNHIFIETVGVGQSETAVHSMSDFFLLLMLAGAGDELQGIKRGIMEMADLIAINKADGSNLEKAEMAKQQYRNALHLFPKKDSGWEPPVLSCSAINKTGVSEIWKKIGEYVSETKRNGWFDGKRNEQAAFWMYETINDHLKNRFYSHIEVKHKLKILENEVLENRISPFSAASKLLDFWSGKQKQNL